MNRADHARLARELIEAIGTLTDAARHCRVSVSKLSEYQNKDIYPPRYMPADVIADLEAVAGEPIYSGALFRRVEQAVATVNLRTASCELAEQGVDFSREVRLALEDGELSPNEDQAIAKREAAVEAALLRSRAAREAARGNVVGLDGKARA